MQRTKSLIHVGGVSFQRHGNAGTQSPGRANSGTNERLIDLSPTMVNNKNAYITGLPERHSLD